MNWTNVQGNWNEAKGKVKNTWGKLTDDDLMQVEGNKDRLVGVIQQRYGIARDKAEQQLEEFLSSADGWAARAKEGAQDAVEKGRQYVQQGREALHRGVENGREYVQQGREAVEHGIEKGREYVQEGRDYVRATSMSAMATDLKDLIGRHPVHSAIIGVGLGFLFGRLLTPTNRRQS